MVNPLPRVGPRPSSDRTEPFIGRAVFEIGSRLKRVHDDALWQVVDYTGFEDYLARGVAISRSTAYRFMRIADYFNAEIARRYGPEKLDAAIRYLRATPVEERPGDQPAFLTPFLLRRRLEVTPQWYLETLRARIDQIDWRQARADVERFLSSSERDQAHVALWNRELFHDQIDRMARYLAA